MESNLLLRMKTFFHYNPDDGEFSRIKDNGKYKAGCKVGAVHPSNRLVINFEGKNYFAYHLAWWFTYGVCDIVQIDHINHNSMDNRISNLRLVTPQENAKNRTIYSSNKTGCPGVSFCKSRLKWVVKMRINGIYKQLGRFNDFFEAVCVRKSAEKIYGFHPNHGRLI